MAKPSNVAKILHSIHIDSYEVHLKKKRKGNVSIYKITYKGIEIQFICFYIQAVQQEVILSKLSGTKQC